MADLACGELVGAQNKPCGARPATDDPAAGGPRCARHHSDRVGVAALDTSEVAKAEAIYSGWPTMDDTAKAALRARWPRIVAAVEARYAEVDEPEAEPDDPPDPPAAAAAPAPAAIDDSDPVVRYALALAEAEGAKLQAQAAQRRADALLSEVMTRIGESGPMAVPLEHLGLIVTVYVESGPGPGTESVKHFVAKRAG